MGSQGFIFEHGSVTDLISEAVGGKQLPRSEPNVGGEDGRGLGGGSGEKGGEEEGEEDLAMSLSTGRASCGRRGPRDVRGEAGEEKGEGSEEEDGSHTSLIKATPLVLWASLLKR